MLSREDREIMDRLISGEHPMTSDTPPDQPAAPDEDAADVEVDRIAKVVFNRVKADWGGDGEWVKTELATEYVMKVLRSEGWTRRPVDTRPTRSEVAKALWKSKMPYTSDEWCPERFHYQSTFLKRADAMIEAGYATPDPAPAAEVPVVEVPADLINAAINTISDLCDEVHGFATDHWQRDAGRNLLAALTKATDR